MKIFRIRGIEKFLCKSAWMSIIYLCIYSCYPIWNSIIALSVKDSVACTIAVYIKGKPIITVSGSLCGVNAGIIGFVLMEEHDIKLALSSLRLFFKKCYLRDLKRNVTSMIVTAPIIFLAHTMRSYNLFRYLYSATFSTKSRFYIKGRPL